MRTPSRGQGYARNKAQSAFANLWDGLVGHWAPPLGPTGLTLFDVSGNGNHGALTNMDAATDWVVGEKGYALDYGGASDFVDIPNVDALIMGTQSWTVSAWAKGGGGVVQRGILNTWNGGGASDNYRLVVKDAVTGGGGIVDKVSFVIYDSAVGPILNSVTSATTVTDGEWYLITGVRDVPADEMRIYINGKEEDSAVFLGNRFVNNTAPLKIGRGFTGGWPWNDAIGDVFIHNRALNPNEIADMAAGASPLILKRRMVGKASLVVAVASAIYSAIEIKTSYKAREIESSYSATEKKTSYRARTDEEIG